MSDLDKAVAIAVRAHAGQTDKYGQPYILHPIRVMMRMQTGTERIVALLHDVVEHSGISREDLRAEGFDGEVIEAVALLTKNPDQSYTDYVTRLAHNSLARAVKLSDLEDNMDLKRIASLSEADNKLLQKYHWAWQFLSEVK